MTPKDIRRLSVAADLAYAKALRGLAPVEAERRRLAGLREAALAAARASHQPDADGAVTAADLAFAALSRRAARHRLEELDRRLEDHAPKLEDARMNVRRALAKTEVVSALGERLQSENRLAEGRADADAL